MSDAPKATFKKKSVRGQGRSRTRNDDDFGGVSLFSSVKRTAAKAAGNSKWTKYASLKSEDPKEEDPAEKDHIEKERKTVPHEDYTAPGEPAGQDDANEVLTGDVANATETDEFDAMVVDSVPTLQTANEAYTKVEMSTAKTFSLRESHFREETPQLSLKDEYADKYGNVEDEDEVQKPDDEADDAEAFETVDYSDRAAFRDDFYDLEVSVDEDTAKEVQVPTVAGVMDELAEKMARLETLVVARKAKLQTLKLQLEEAESRRAQLTTQL